MLQSLQPSRLVRLSTFVLLLTVTVPTLGDTIVLKNGLIYRGTTQQDNTLVFVYDGLKQVVIRDSKIARRVADNSVGNKEVFKLDQPIVQHAGVMPKEAYDIKASRWNERAQRTFE